MATIVYVMGPTACGKTTVSTQLASLLFSKDCPTATIEADVLHPPANVAKMTRGEPLNDGDRWPWLKSVREAATREAEKLEATNGRAAVVVACSGLKKAYRRLLAGVSDAPEPRTGGAINPVLFLYLHTTPDLVRERIGARKGHFMNPKLVDSQFSTLEEPAIDEGGGEYSVEWIEVPGRREDEIAADALAKLDQFWSSRTAV